MTHPKKTKYFFLRSLLLTASLFIIASLFKNSISQSAVSSPANTEVLKRFPPDKPLTLIPQFVVVDDFVDAQLKNKRGEIWRVDQPANKSFSISLGTDDGRNKKRGNSLKLNFQLAPHETRYFESGLSRLDISAAKQLVCKLRLHSADLKPVQGQIQIQINDWKDNVFLSSVKNLEPIKQNVWFEWSIPTNQGADFDWDQIVSIRLSLSSQDKSVKGELDLDDLAFWGQGNLSFESHRDNIAGFPTEKNNQTRRKEILGIRDEKKLFQAIAGDTWKYFQFAKDKTTGLVADHIRSGPSPLIADYTSITNVAMQILSIISAKELSLISPDEAKKQLLGLMDTLELMKRHDGFFYNFYDTKKLAVTRNYISTVDSGWLAISLVVLRQAFPEDFSQRVTSILDSFNFSDFLDPENNQLMIGLDLDPKKSEKNSYHYGMLVSEARATSLYAIGKGDISSEHWWFLYRTPPEVWKWQSQTPKGQMMTEDGIDYFQGYYVHNNKKFVPSWGGSLFEFLMPTLVLKEKELAPHSFGPNNQAAVELHRDYALVEKKYPVWGISPAAMTNGRNWKYGEFGVKAFGAKGYRDEGVITPHVSFLALDSLPKDALTNIRKLIELNVYGEYGFFDSIQFKKDRSAIVNPQYLALDQGMILVAICNYLKNGAIQNLFHQDPIGKKAEELLGKESFFIN